MPLRKVVVVREDPLALPSDTTPSVRLKGLSVYLLESNKAMRAARIAAGGHLTLAEFLEHYFY